MTRKSINTDHESVACDVCGRTLLRGEQSDVYLAGGGRRHVCELCTRRATHEGWIREGSTDFDLGAGSEGRRSLLGRLRYRRERAEREGTLAPLPEDLLPDPDAPGPETAVYHEPRHVHAVPTGETQKLARALDLFNASEHVRTVAGVARSLGAPAVSVRTGAEHPSMVRVVVAWEISWYRYEVDLADEQGGVRLAGQGYELAELAEEEQVANGTADEQGRLALVAALE